MVKKHSVSDTARTALLTDLRRWPGDGFFGKIPKSESRPWWKNPDLGAGSAGLRRRAGAAGRLCQAGMWRARRWASQYSLGEPVLIGRARIGRAIKRGWGEPSNEVGASHQTRLGEPVLRGPLGEPVLIGRTRIGRAIKRGWGEPSNEVGRAGRWASQYSLGEPVLGEPSNEVGASHQTRLGEPVLRGRWASHSTFTASTPASKLAWRGAYSACSARLLRHLLSACSAHLLSACSARLVKCQLGTVPARHV